MAAWRYRTDPLTSTFRNTKAAATESGAKAVSFSKTLWGNMEKGMDTPAPDLIHKDL